MINKEKIMIDKMICVVYVESDNAVRYVVITDQQVINEVIELNTTSLNLYTDSDFPAKLSSSLILTLWQTDFPHSEFASADNPMVITIYF